MATLWGGNVRTTSIACWKARGRLRIRHNWTFFRYLLRLRPYKRKSVEVGVLEGSWLWAQISDGRGVVANHCWYQKTRVIALLCCIRTSAMHCLVFTKHACGRRTDRRAERQTDGQNYDSQDRSSIAARAVKLVKVFAFTTKCINIMKTMWKTVFAPLEFDFRNDQSLKISHNYSPSGSWPVCLFHGG